MHPSVVRVLFCDTFFQKVSLITHLFSSIVYILGDFIFQFETSQGGLVIFDRSVRAGYNFDAGRALATISLLV